MGELETISASKEIFYKEFPYVIPNVFRKVADEILVELHLLSHQNKFKPDSIFALGLTKAFEELTSGYKPESHLEDLFNALCSCNRLDPTSIKSKANKVISSIVNTRMSDLKNFIEESDKQEELERIFKKGEDLYNRLRIIGVLNIVRTISINENNTNENEIKDLTKSIGSKLGYPKERVDKDISLYIASVDKIKQSIELIKLINTKNKRS